MLISFSAKKHQGKDGWSIDRHTATDIENSVKAGAAHIAFTAPTRTAVRDFYAAALNAGARPNGAPACRCGDDQFNAAVMDLDGNSIEVVYRARPDVMHDGTVIEHSRVITWQRSVYESHGSRSVVSSASKAAPIEIASSKAASVAPTPPAAPARSVSEPVVPQTTPPAATPDRSDNVSTTILGTLFGAAAGAAVAYAMVRSERDSAKKESDFNNFMDAKSIVKAAAGHFAGTSSQPQQSLPAPQPVEESAHRNNDAQSYHSATPPQARSVHTPLAIDAVSYHSSSPPLQDYAQYQAAQRAPPTYYSASEVSQARTAKPLELEYAPAQSVAGSQARSRYTTARSVTSPELMTMNSKRSGGSIASTVKAPTEVPESRATSVYHSAAPSRAPSAAPSRAPSAAPSRSPSVAQSPAPSRAPSAAPSKAHSVAHSAAPSTLISSFVADHEPRRSGEGSVHSHHSSRSKAKSSYTDASKSSRSKHRSHREEAVEPSPSPPPAPPMPAPKPSRFQTKAASVISSVFGKSSASKNDDFIDDLDIEEETEDDDLDTVVPSDSISQIGDPSRRRRKKHTDGSSVISKHSSTSKSSRSRRIHKDSDDADDDKASMHSSASKSRRRHRTSVASEPSEASTVRPVKSSSRKDSVTQGQYDGLFDEVKYGTGSVAVRGITPSMISAANKNNTRTVVRHDMAQKAKLFED
jgi:hypothetical protein